MHIIKLSDAPIFELPGVKFTALAAPSRGSKENSVWRVKIAPHSPPHPHRVTREEIFVALAGNAIAKVAGKSYQFAAGSALIVPANVEFSLENPNTTSFEAIALLPVGGQAVVGDDPPFVPPWAA